MQGFTEEPLVVGIELTLRRRHRRIQVENMRSFSSFALPTNHRGEVYKTYAQNLI
jgi:hypothetical protein